MTVQQRLTESSREKAKTLRYPLARVAFASVAVPRAAGHRAAVPMSLAALHVAMFCAFALPSFTCLYIVSMIVTHK